jgi:transcriptional regulator with XRE-family HTH domain
MEQVQKFGKKLRQLRKARDLSLRELARKAGVSFTYLSKLESGQLPPPSESAVARLAGALSTDRDELLQLSGRVPADIAGMVKNRARQEFGLKLKELRKRAGLTQQELAEKVGISATYLSKIENGIMPPPTRGVIIRLAEVVRTNKNELLNLAGKNPINIARMREKLNAGNRGRSSMFKISLTRTSAYRAVLAIFLVIAFALSLWYASPAPVKAVDINITNGATGTLGQVYSFSFRVDVQDTDVLPIQSVDLRIYKANATGIYEVLFADLPLPATPNTRLSRGYTGAGGSAAISGTTGPVWTNAQDTRYGYGYGYQNQTWETINFGYGYGYGYGYGGSYQGAAYIDYSVVWVPPSSWPVDYYRIQVIVYGASGDNSKAFTNDTVAQFYLMAPVSGVGGVAQPSVTPVTVDSEHRFTQDYTVYSDDNQVTLEIPMGARGETATGEGLTQISITRITDPPELPADTNRVALVYDLEPDGAQFPDGITLTMRYDPTAIVGGTLVIAYWNGSAWVDLEGPFQIDPVAHTVSTTIYHFTPFTVIENIRPAAFTTSDLTISPQEVEIGEVASIAVTVTNTGDLAGIYNLFLKVNGTDTDRVLVSLQGQQSVEATFNLSRDTAGTYTISIDGLSGTLIVKALPTPTSTPTLTPTPTPTPTPTSTLTPTPTPSPTPTLGAAEEGLAWWYIVIIVAGVIIIATLVTVLWYRRRA